MRIDWTPRERQLIIDAVVRLRFDDARQEECLTALIREAQECLPPSRQRRISTSFVVPWLVAAVIAACKEYVDARHERDALQMVIVQGKLPSQIKLDGLQRTLAELRALDARTMPLDQLERIYKSRAHDRDVFVAAKARELDGPPPTPYKAPKARQVRRGPATGQDAPERQPMRRLKIGIAAITDMRQFQRFEELMATTGTGIRVVAIELSRGIPMLDGVIVPSYVRGNALYKQLKRVAERVFHCAEGQIAVWLGAALAIADDVQAGQRHNNGRFGSHEALPYLRRYNLAGLLREDAPPTDLGWLNSPEANN